MDIKKIALWATFIIGAIFVTAVIGMCLFTMYKSLMQTWGMGAGQKNPYVSSVCNTYKTSKELVVTIGANAAKFKNVTCQIVTKGGMESDKDSAEIPLIPENSSDLCVFNFKGTPEGSANVRVSGTVDGMFSDDSYVTISTPYPACAEPTQATSKSDGMSEGEGR